MMCISYHNTFNCNLEIMRLVHLNTLSTVCSFVGIHFLTHLLLPKNAAEIKNATNLYFELQYSICISILYQSKSYSHNMNCSSKKSEIFWVNLQRHNINTSLDFISSFSGFIWVANLHLKCNIMAFDIFFYSSIPHIKFPIHRICQNQKYWQFSQMTFAQLLWILPKTKMKINTNSIDDIFCVLIYFDTIILYMYLLSTTQSISWYVTFPYESIYIFLMMQK